MIKLADPQEIVRKVIEKVGKDLRIATPLGLGKPNHLLNAFYRTAKCDPTIQLTIMTALTLQKPTWKSDLERRFLQPMVERIFGNYPDLDYEVERTHLPKNVRVIEFYFQAGKQTHNPKAQQDYVSSNYTHVARDLSDHGTNVILQMVASDFIDGQESFSLSCNPDVTLDLIENLRIQEKAGKLVACVAMVNNELPFMYGDAVVSPNKFHFICENKELEYKLFGPPKTAVNEIDFMIGLYASTLIRDSGELQIGIGALGDAFTYCLLLRQKKSDEYQNILSTHNIHKRYEGIIDKLGGTTPFKVGLFGATEMFVDGFIHLIQNGILKRKVYDDPTLQRLLNEGRISEDIGPETVLALLAKHKINTTLTLDDFMYLQEWGVFSKDVSFENGIIHHIEAGPCKADLVDADSRAWIFKNALGDKLKNGHIVHGGFFVGPQSFYRFLKNMTPEERKLISMRSVLKINQLYGHEDIDRLHRTHARFVNTCLMMTLTGGAVSDGLENGQVISGVGGQYNFVAMAHALPDGRSIIQLRSTRRNGKKLESNIVWNYGHITIARHLRDIVITEYGIADLRGKTDAEVIDQLIRIADSHFQDELIAKAKSFGKLPNDYELPAEFRQNLPATYTKKNIFPEFPFGTDLTPEEIILGGALKSIKNAATSKIVMFCKILISLTRWSTPEKVVPFIKRMQLDQPSSIKEWFWQRLLVNELR